MKITSITNNWIEFDNGKKITFDHDQDCCEDNYADFNQLDTIGRSFDFQEPLYFEAVQDSGFRFGNKDAMFFIPCYSYQNGYYTTQIDIYYNNVMVLSFNAEMEDK